MNKSEIPTPKKCPKCYNMDQCKFTLIDLEWDTDGEKTGLEWSCDECGYGWPVEEE